MKAKIYKITNLINNKVYIGKTTVSLEERFKIHIKDSKKRDEEQRPLYYAFQKYGIENFIIELVEECDYQILNEREQYWINFYNSYSNGYNATLGGDGKILYDYSIIEELLRSGKTTNEIKTIIGCCADTVYKVAHALNIDLKRDNDLAKQMKSSRIKVDQYDLYGQYIQTFDSYADAAKWLLENGKIKKICGGVRSHIGEVCNGKRGSAYGYSWKKH